MDIGEEINLDSQSGLPKIAGGCGASIQPKFRLRGSWSPAFSRADDTHGNTIHAARRRFTCNAIYPNRHRFFCTAL